MKTLILTLTLMLLMLTAGHAGPNEGGILAVHGNAEVLRTYFDPCTDIPLPATCSELIPTGTPGPGLMEWFLVVAVREPEPLSFSVVIFGLGDYDQEACYIGWYDHGPCHQELEPVEIPNAGWPGPHSGTIVTWDPHCLEGNLVPVYYFGIYVYAPGQIPLGPWNVDHPSIFFSCPDPAEDDIAAFGIMGCGGAEGYNPCPISSVSDDSDIEEAKDESTTWSRIKTMYR